MPIKTAATAMPAFAPVLNPLLWLSTSVAAVLLGAGTAVVEAGVLVLVGSETGVLVGATETGAAQVPNLLWQPSATAQYVPLPPQKPEAEQQFPHLLPWHDALSSSFAPQEPDVLMTVVLQVPKPDWQPSSQ